MVCFCVIEMVNCTLFLMPNVFTAMFESSMLESTLDRIELQEVSRTWLRRLVRFAYLHRIHLNMGEIYDAMTTARMLQFNEAISR